MSIRKRRSPLARLRLRRRIERSEPLKGQLWTRSERALREPGTTWRQRLLAIAAIAAESVVLGWLWFGGGLAVRVVDVIGAAHMSPAQVARAAGISTGSPIVSVDGEAARQRLLGQLWIRSADVTVQLPSTVVIRVSEWQPVAVYHAGRSSRLFLLSSQAVVLGPAAGSAQLLDVQGPGGSDPRAGQTVLDPMLLVAMINMDRAFPVLVGQQVAGFVFDSCGELTLITKRGWKVYFGRVLTPEEFSALNDKLSALKAIGGNSNVDYGSSDLDYVNVMNPSEPAVAYRSQEPPSPSPSASSAPSTPQPATCS